MREIGLRALAALCEQAADIADAVLLDSYLFCSIVRSVAWEASLRNSSEHLISAFFPVKVLTS